MYQLGNYISGSSWLHRCDPRLKIFAIAAWSILILQADWPLLAVSLVLLLFAAACSGVPIRLLYEAWRPARWFLLLILLMHFLFTPGTPLGSLHLGSMTLTREGLILGAIVVTKFSLLLLIGSLITLVTLPSDLVAGMEKLLKPINLVGLSSHNLAFMLSLSLRLIPAFLEEMERMKEAQMARGAVFDAGSPINRVRAATLLASNLTANILRYCDGMVEAIEARAFQNGPRTGLREIKLTSIEYVLIALICLATPAILWFS